MDDRKLGGLVENAGGQDSCVEGSGQAREMHQQEPHEV